MTRKLSKMEYNTRQLEKSSSEITIHATLELRGKTATGFVIPEKSVMDLGPSKKPRVKVTFKDFTYRTSIASMKGEFLLPVSAEIRNQTGVKAGDQIELRIELDTLPRDVVVPDDFNLALKDYPEGLSFFESLSYSNKRRVVESIQEAKTKETRLKRITDTIAKLNKRNK